MIGQRTEEQTAEEEKECGEKYLCTEVKARSCTEPRTKGIRTQSHRAEDVLI